MRRLSGCVLVASACSGSAAVVEIPIAEGTRALVIVELPASGAPAAEALSIEAEPRATYATISASPGAPASLNALEYRCALSELGIAPGVVLASPAGAPLPSADVAYRADRGPSGVSPFARVTPGEASLGGARFDVRARPPPSACSAIERTFRSVEGTCGHLLRWAVPLGGAGVLLGLDDGRLVRSTRDGESVVGTTPGFEGLAAFVAEDGELWIVSSGGGVWRGTPERGFSSGPPLVVRDGRRVAITGARSGQPFELFVATNAGDLERFDGTRWQLVDMGEPGEAVDVAWLGPGEAIAVGTRPGQLVHARRGGAELVTVPGERPTSVVFAPLLGGGLVGTDRGRIHALSAAGLTLVVEDPAGYEVRKMAPLGDGLFFGGRFGTMSQFHPASGVCPAASVAPKEIDHLVPIEGGYFIGGDNGPCVFTTRLTVQAEMDRGACPG